MKIRAIPIPTSASPNPQPVILGDDEVGDFVSAVLPEQTREVQIEGYPDAAIVDVWDRGNRTNSVSARVDRQHADTGAASIFLLTHPDTVPIQASVEFSENGTVRVLNGAAIQSVKCVLHKGINTVFEYRIVGGSWSNTVSTT